MPSAINEQRLIVLFVASLTICSCNVAALSISKTLTTTTTTTSSSSSLLTHSHPVSNRQHETNTINNNNNQHQIDAPKFYYLNELLYKTANGDKSPQSVAVPKLRPLGGTEATPTSRDLQPRGMMVAHGSTAAADRDDRDDEPSSIEGLVKRMRGRKPHEAATSDSIGASGGGDSANSISDGSKRGNEATRGPTNGGSNFFGPNDEATIQRKSTNLDDESSGAAPEASGSPSRIRARDNIPRRKRRASARQAPPKLKSRRISRNSRRRKLRHGIKPRRRA